ncbi:NAC domain-containing protein 86-like [Ananas comosus]|uniref:NAC domain-containing protein 86-like n=1 Tax=Ananas comosus TaxID=4615 RepID=A0A6P5FEY8_ANACO|nr:NAC domain-containing protein 86-like [Ananas comosus]
MTSMTLPPGFRFHPTDDELVGYYLKRKVDGVKIELDVIPVVDLYKFEPWELPDKSFLPKRDLEWFFFCPRDRKYPNGSRTNRATVSGYWKATGKDRKIVCELSIYGIRKTLVFYQGRAPGGERTDWIMHEYRLCEDFSHGTSNFVGGFALCRVVKRNDNGLKTSDLESKAKRGPSPILGLSLEGCCSKASKIPEEHSSLASTVSTPINSPEDIRRDVEFNPVLIDSDHQIQHALKSAQCSEAVYQSATTPWLPSSAESNSPCSPSHLSSINFAGDDFLINDFHGDECLSFLPSLEELSDHSFEFDMLKYPNTSLSGAETWNQLVPPTICRQESAGEEANLWFQEDNMIIMI